MNCVELIGFLIIFPLIAALLLLLVKNNTGRNIIVYASAFVTGLASLVLVFTNIGTPGVYFEFSSQVVEYICTIVSVLIGACVLAYAIRYKNVWAGLLAAVQLAASLVFDFAFAPKAQVQYELYFDSLSLVMAFIIGIVGSGICVYAIGYMEDFQKQHADQKDRRNIFFSLMFLFLSAMYVIVFSNNMTWMFTGWEVTTVCSFLLIGFTKTDEAIHNAFRQIIMNIAGGIGFLVAMYFMAAYMGTLDFQNFLMAGTMYPAYVVFPVTCLAFAGLTKAAQMPFHSWLLGAMVAPTPTSALLHSSTMVKAGVFLLLKLAPIFSLTLAPALMVILVGGITFCLASFMAISQSNAKRVLAYSTIANLGLIVACAGVGTPEAVWAGIYLIIFHAFAKSLLFLCVGTAEHHIGSRNIEDMDLLFERMPKLARMMMVGIMTMFIAPLGMLVAKWAALMSFVDTKQIALIVLLAFGSAATFMFWAKWLGKLAGIAAKPENEEVTVHTSEWIALITMLVLIIISCVGMPAISTYFVMPYLYGLGADVSPALSADTLELTAVLSGGLLLIMLTPLRQTGKNAPKKVPVYMAGVGLDNDRRVFQNSMSKETTATARNWYMEPIFGEARINPVAVVSTTAIIIVAFALSVSTMSALF